MLELTKLAVLKLIRNLTHFIPANSRTCAGSNERLQHLASAASDRTSSLSTGSETTVALRWYCT